MSAQKGNKSRILLANNIIYLQKRAKKRRSGFFANTIFFTSIILHIHSASEVIGLS